LILIWNQFYEIIRKQKHRTPCIHSTQKRKLKTDFQAIINVILLIYLHLVLCFKTFVLKHLKMTSFLSKHTVFKRLTFRHRASSI